MKIAFYETSNEMWNKSKHSSNEDYKKHFDEMRQGC